MASISEQIREAALGREPTDAYRNILAAWLKHADDEATSAAYGFLDTLEEWWSAKVDADARRTFLLLVACALDD